MKKSIYLIMTIAAAFLNGCGSTNSGDGNYEVLSDRELFELENYVAYNIRTHGNYLNQEQSDMLKDIRPTTKITYDGDKEGKVYFSWDIPQNERYARKLAEDPNTVVPYKTINVRGYGDLSDPPAVSWQVSIVNQGDLIITPAAERLMKGDKKPEKSFTPEQYNDIRNR